MGARDDLRAELRGHLDAAATKVGAVTAALDASVLEAKLGGANDDIKEAVLLTDGLSAMRLQIPGLHKEERTLVLPGAYAAFRARMGLVHARLLAAVDAIDNPPAP